jgi:hypothetical protein
LSLSFLPEITSAISSRQGTISGKALKQFWKGGIMSNVGAQPVTDPAAKLSQWQRVANIFTAPSKTFQDIKNGNRSWWMPLIIFTVFAYLLFAVVYTRIGIQQVVDNQIHLSPSSEARLAQASPAQRETSNKISVGITEAAFIANPVFVMVGVALMSLVIWGTINFAFGGRATFGGIFAMWMYATLPSIIKSILGMVTILAGMAPESFNIKNMAPTNLGAFLDPIETNKALYSIASSIDIITIWTLILLGIGTSIIAGVKRTSGYIAVFGWWVVVVLIGAGIAAVTG